MKRVALRLPDDVARRLQRLANRTGRSKAFHMIEAIREHLDDLEDRHRRGAA
ncbi:MAG: ribbon-helix-helix domain-containing protein [Acidobacteriota bacterium]|nr:ribbon-helix-helix domain-containing protein [Acidobacteriota bacterium]